MACFVLIRFVLIRFVLNSLLSNLKETIMHDIDRTQMEFAHEGQAFEAEGFEYGQHEYGQHEYGQHEYGQHEYGQHEVFTEAQEMELAYELLSVTNEAELDHFLGNLIRSAGSAIGKAVRSPVGQAIGGMLKGVAKKALPMAGTALGTYFGGPLGAKIGGSLGQFAANAIGQEAESWEMEDREVEGARQFVRMAGEVVSNVANAGPGVDPRVAAQEATNAAVRRCVPGLLNPSAAGARPPRSAGAPSAAAAASDPSSVPGRTGRWVRRGNKVILYGI